jgi:hypothetical protein
MRDLQRLSRGEMVSKREREGRLAIKGQWAGKQDVLGDVRAPGSFGERDLVA